MDSNCFSFQSRLNLYLEYTKPTLDPDEEMEEGMFTVSNFLMFS